MIQPDDRANLWFPAVTADKAVKIRLFCFPFAGGNIFTYRSWKKYLPQSVDVCPVQLPGRSNRISEPALSDISLLCDVLEVEIEPFLEVPFAVFGHSLGALVGFEMIRRLRKKNRKPLHFFPSSAKAPPYCKRAVPLQDLPVEELKIELQKLNGTPIEVLNHPELFALLLPTLRSDFKIMDTYRYTDESALDCPLTVFGGVDDDIDREDLMQWKHQTSSVFKIEMFDGNHFYLNEQTDRLLSAIYTDLAAYL